MDKKFDAEGYHEEAGVYFWTEANQEGENQYRGVCNITMPTPDGSALLPDLKLMLPGIESRLDAAQASAHDFAVVIARAGIAKMLVESWRQKPDDSTVIRTDAPCDLCKGMTQNRRGVKGHEGLEEVGSRPGATMIGQAKVDIRSYTCRYCGTAWEYENDRSDPHVGWSMV